MEWNKNAQRKRFPKRTSKLENMLIVEMFRGMCYDMGTMYWDLPHDQ